MKASVPAVNSVYTESASLTETIQANQERKLVYTGYVAVEVFDPEMVGTSGYDYEIMSSFARNKVSYIAKNTNANTITHYVSERNKNLQICLDELHAGFPGAKIATRQVAIIAVIGSNMKIPGFLSRAAKALAEANINILALDQCMRQVNMQFIIDRADFEAAQKALHCELVEKQ